MHQRMVRQAIANAIPAERKTYRTGTAQTWVVVRKQKLAMRPQSYRWGQEAQVDWHEAQAILGGEMKKLQIFAMGSMASGGTFHRYYFHNSGINKYLPFIMLAASDRENKINSTCY